MKNYDVIIVGAGPGGLRCAEILSSSKLKVLVLEKNETIGPKVCAGGLTNKDIDLLNLPKDILGHSFSNVTLYHKKTKLDMKQSQPYVHTVDRKALGQWQLKRLKEVEIRTKAKVTNIQKNYVIINDKEKLGYKYLIGADGSVSIVRKYLKIPTKKVGVAFQYIIPTNKYKNMEMYFDSSKFKAWYAWIFPHKNFVSIGTGGDPKKTSMKKLKKNFHEWIKTNNVDITKATYEAFPISFDYRGYRFNNIFLIGDAAGLASPITGEGIYQALASGEDVAKLIINPQYKPKKLLNVIKSMKHHYIMAKILLYAGPLRPLIFGLTFLILRNDRCKKYFIRKLS